MGVLDDAIREHLELKRRHGAAEEEIARKEAEALGPARRGPAPDADAPEPPVADAAPPAAESVVEGPAAPAEPEPEAPVAETEPVPAGEDAAAAPHEPTIDVPAEVEPPAAIDPPGGEPVEAAHPPVHDVDRDPAEPPPPVPGATQEFDALSARDEEEPAPAGDEDVLEETPEFLRETPEHDRLWFEQKPPRDFDLED
jgi:hypothetical protein